MRPTSTAPPIEAVKKEKKRYEKEKKKIEKEQKRQMQRKSDKSEKSDDKHKLARVFKYARSTLYLSALII